MLLINLLFLELIQVNLYSLGIFTNSTAFFANNQFSKNFNLSLFAFFSIINIFIQIFTFYFLLHSTYIIIIKY